MPTGISAAGDEQAIRELGEQILAELDASRTNDTLTRWLAHHVADLIKRADAAAAEGGADADRLARETRTAILRLWQHRSAWPDGWPPRRAAEMARLLDSVPTIGEEAWHERTMLSQLNSLHLLILATLVDLASASLESLEEDWLVTFGKHLTDDEVTMLRRAAETADRLARWEAAVPDASEPSPETADDHPHPLTDLARRYQEAVRAVVERARANTESSSSLE